MTTVIPTNPHPQPEWEAVLHLQRLAENSPDVVFRHAYQPSPHLQYISPSVFTILGYRPEEFYADPRLFAQIIHPDDREWLLKLAPEDVSSGQAWVCRWLHRDGQTVWMEAYNLHIYDDAGTLIAVEGISRDVSQQKETESQLQRANRALRLVLASTKAVARAQDEPQLLHDVCSIITGSDYALAWVGFHEFDAEKSVRIVTQAGSEVDYCQKITLTWDAAVPSGQGPVGRAIREHTPIVVQNIAANPLFFWQAPAAEHGLQATVALPLLREEVVIGLLAVYSKKPDAFDVAEVELLMELADELAFGLIALRARMEAQLAQAAVIDTELLRVQLEHERDLSELKSRFIAMASHEFRTPLTAILSSTDILRLYGNRMTDERQLEHLNTVRSAVEHLTDMLDDILVVDDGQAGMVRFSPAPIDLQTLCGDLVREILMHSEEERHIDYSFSGDASGAVMDRQLIRQIFTNLLNNALKYSPAPTSVRFDVRCDHAWAVFHIEDHGIGVPDDDQHRLFDTFYRAGNVGSVPGTGLGLTIVKASVDLHGGTLTFKSRVGQGTTFIVKLPLRPIGSLG